MKFIYFRAAIAASAAFSAAQALTAPIYITCQFGVPGKPEVRRFTLNEEQGRVSIFYPETAESQTVQAGFSLDAVTFETYVDRYIIGRTSLVGLRQAKLDGKIEQAKCRIETPEKRAF